MNFVDETRLHVVGGDGGNGCVAFRREKFVPHGGPAGGDGGHGGSVLLVGDEGMNTLYHLRFRSRYAAKRGRHGEGSNRTGRSGEDLTINVPLGTEIYDAETNEMVGEIVRHGESVVVAEGGRGGRGNARFATATNRAPRRVDPGAPGVERELRLELKLLADVGVIGLPNAGKSSLIAAISASRTKVADYPFTTVVPQLGVVALDETTTPFVIADLPGLIEGAAQGAGLGIRFLRHVERCRILIHLVDLSAFEGSAASELEVVERELAGHSTELMERPRLIIGSKVDAVVEARREELRSAAESRGLPYREISSVSRQGLEKLTRELSELLSKTALAEEAT